MSAGPRNGPRGGGSGPGLHRAEITEQTNEPRRAALRSGGGLGCFIFWCVCVCAVWRWAPTEGVRFQEGAAGRGAEGSLGTARCGEGSGGGGAVRLREERERREPPAGAERAAVPASVPCCARSCERQKGNTGSVTKRTRCSHVWQRGAQPAVRGGGRKSAQMGGGRCGTRGARSACVGCGLSVYGYGCVIGANWSPACSGTQLREHPASL